MKTKQTINYKNKKPPKKYKNKNTTKWEKNSNN